MGPDRAPIMMELLPPVGWGEVATKTDLMVLDGRLRGEMAELRAEMGGLASELRSNMARLDSSLRGEMAELRGELRGAMAELRGELRGAMGELSGELRQDMAQNLRTMVAATVASNVALVAAVFGVVRVFGV